MSSRGDEHFEFERKPRRQQQWIPVGNERMLSVEEGMLVEYDVPSRAPIGAVFLSVGEAAFPRPSAHCEESGHLGGVGMPVQVAGDYEMDILVRLHMLCYFYGSCEE